MPEKPFSPQDQVILDQIRSRESLPDLVDRLTVAGVLIERNSQIELEKIFLLTGVISLHSRLANEDPNLDTFNLAPNDLVSVESSVRQAMFFDQPKDPLAQFLKSTLALSHLIPPQVSISDQDVSLDLDNFPPFYRHQAELFLTKGQSRAQVAQTIRGLILIDVFKHQFYPFSKKYAANLGSQVFDLLPAVLKEFRNSNTNYERFF